MSRRMLTLLAAALLVLTPAAASADVFDLLAAVMAVGGFAVATAGAVTANICKVAIVKTLYGGRASVPFKSFAKLTLMEILIMTGSLAVSFLSVASSITGPDTKAVVLFAVLGPAAVLHCTLSILPHTWFLERAAVTPNGSPEKSRDFIRAGLMGLLTPFWVSLLMSWAVLSLG